MSINSNGPSRVTGGAPTPAEYNLDKLYTLGYTTYAGKPIIGLTDVISHINSGTSITAKNGVITFSFLDGPHTTGQYNNPHQGFRSPAAIVLCRQPSRPPPANR